MKRTRDQQKVRGLRAKLEVLGDLRNKDRERHARGQTTLGRFLECAELQSAAAILARAVEQCSRWRAGKRLLPPGGSLPPTG
jgi:hypothetical protein